MFNKENLAIQDISKPENLKRVIFLINTYFDQLMSGYKFNDVIVNYSNLKSISVSPGTMTIPAGKYIIKTSANTRVEVNINGWVTLVPVNRADYVFSDGTNFRYNNTGAASETIYYKKL